MQISTLGYEGATTCDFDHALRLATIDCVVDVGAVPISRKRGFSKNALRERLDSLGISYVHLRGLGDPKPGRDAARAGMWGIFESIFAEHMLTAAAQSDLSTLRVLAAEHRVALLCYEADHTKCHRSIVASLLAPEGCLDVYHLRVDSSGDAHVNVREGDHISQGLATA